MPLWTLAFSISWRNRPQALSELTSATVRPSDLPSAAMHMATVASVPELDSPKKPYPNLNWRHSGLPTLPQPWGSLARAPSRAQVQSGPGVGQQPSALALDSHMATTSGVRTRMGDCASEMGSAPLALCQSRSNFWTHDSSPGERTVGSMRPATVSETIVPER